MGGIICYPFISTIFIGIKNIYLINYYEIIFQFKYIKWFYLDEKSYRNDHSDRGYPQDWYFRRRALYKQNKGLCQDCGCKTTLAEFFHLKDTPYTHIHHIQPISKLGDHSLKNLQLLCEKCHKKKHEHMQNNAEEILRSPHRQDLITQILDRIFVPLQ